MASSLFSSPQCTTTTPQFKVLRSAKYLQGDKGGKRTTGLKSDLASKVVGFSEAAARRVKGKESRVKSRQCLDDPRAERTVFVGNIPSCCSRKDIKKLLKGHGSIETIRLRSLKVTPGDRPAIVAKRTHKQLQDDSTFNAYVVFSSVAEAEDCLSLNRTLIHSGRHLRVDKVGKKTNSPQENQRSVFVGNIPFSADEEKVREVFSVCGEVEAVRIVRDSKSGVGKGFGYVLFVDKAGVMFSIRQNKKLKIDGRALRVSGCKGQQVIKKPGKVNFVSRKKGGSNSQQVVKKTRKSDSVSSRKGGVNRLVATKYAGKRRPDGTKNRLYRLPASSS